MNLHTILPPMLTHLEITFLGVLPGCAAGLPPGRTSVYYDKSGALPSRVRWKILAFFTISPAPGRSFAAGARSIQAGRRKRLQSLKVPV